MNTAVELDRSTEIKGRVLEVIQLMFNIDQSVIGAVDSGEDLFDQTGIDSLQAFEAIIMLHDLIGDEVPRDIDPGSIATLDDIAAYLDGRYPAERLRPLFDADVAQVVAERSEAADAL